MVTVGGCLRSGDRCSNCGTEYDDCTTLVLLSHRPCCGACGARDTHEERIERGAEMKISELKVGQTVRVTRIVETFQDRALRSVTNTYEGRVTRIGPCSGSVVLTAGADAVTFTSLLDGGTTIELLEDAPLEPGYYVVHYRHETEELVRYWDGELWRRTKTGNTFTSTAQYTIIERLYGELER